MAAGGDHCDCDVALLKVEYNFIHEEQQSEAASQWGRKRLLGDSPHQPQESAGQGAAFGGHQVIEIRCRAKYIQELEDRNRKLKYEIIKINEMLEEQKDKPAVKKEHRLIPQESSS